jgi:hypothetical protein
MPTIHYAAVWNVSVVLNSQLFESEGKGLLKFEGQIC